MKIALVHDWFVSYAGSEKVVAEILAIFPESDLFSVIDFLPDNDRAKLLGKSVITTFLQKLPGAKKNYQKYLPLMPLAIEQLDVSGYDVIISSSHAVAKGVLVGPDQLHICYCHSPIRYAWDLQHQYLRESGLHKGPKAFAARYILHKLRMWDVRTANGVDSFVANSSFISRRIRKSYRRDAEVIYPPVDVAGFSLERDKQDFYLTASRMVPYKKIDLIVRAFNEMPEKQLVVIGDGPDMDKITASAGPNIKVLGYQPFDVLRQHMQKAKAFVFAAEEDFGIAPVEAQACGTPVIAYGKGGATETVLGFGDVSEPTGIFFNEQRTQSIVNAVHCFEENQDVFSAEVCRANALRFGPEVFREKFSALVYSHYQRFKAELS